MKRNPVEVDPDGLDGVLRDDITSHPAIPLPPAPMPRNSAPPVHPESAEAAERVRAQSSLPAAPRGIPRLSSLGASVVLGVVLASAAAALLAPTETGSGSAEVAPQPDPTPAEAQAPAPRPAAAPIQQPAALPQPAEVPPASPQSAEPTPAHELGFPGRFAINGRRPYRVRGKELRSLAAELRGCESITLVGHTCNLGRPQFNLRLGAKRASAARHALRTAGVDTPIQIVSAGALSPTADNGTERGRRANRRVVIRCESTASENGGK